MYDADWLPRLKHFRQVSSESTGWSLPANVWGLGVTSLLTDISSEMVVSILPAYLVMTGGMAPIALGVVTGLHEGGPMLAAWLGGFIADRTGRRKLTAGCGYVISAACRLGWFTLSPDRSVVPIVGLILGDRLGKAIRTAPRDALISLSVRSERLAMAFGLHRALDAAGAALGPVLAFTLLWQLPRRYDLVFFTSFITALLGVAALVLLVDVPTRAAGVKRPAAKPGGRQPFGVVVNPSLRRVLALAIAFGAVTINDAFLYLLLIQRSHAGPQWIPLLYTGTAVALLTLAVPIGYLADRIGKRRMFILSHVPLLAAYVVALGAAGTWPWNALICVALLGMFYASSDGALAGLASDVLSTDTRAIGLAWVATGASGARLGSSILFGFLWTRTGDVTAVLAFAAVLVALTCAGLWTEAIERPITP